MNSGRRLKDSKRNGNTLPRSIVVGLILVSGIFFALARIAVINSERREAERIRGDTLQQSVNALRHRSDEDRAFFEIVKAIMTSESVADRKALIEELRNFKFSTTTTSTTKSTNETSATTTTTVSKVTPATSTTTTTTTTRPPETTSTTRTPPSSTTLTVCVTTPFRNLCT